MNQKLEFNLVEGAMIKALDRIHLKTTNDFYQPTLANIDQKITDVELECEGYSLFDPKTILENFMKYFCSLTECIKRNKNIVVKSLKLNLNGFEVNSNIISRIAKEIHEIGQNLKTLWIHTTDIENVVIEDFSSFLELMIGVGHGTNQNFEDFSLQCANWGFRPRQPNFREFKSVFQNIVAKLEGVILYQKHIRLQFSGWWYKNAEAKMFFGYNSTKQELKQIPKKLQGQYSKFQRSYQDSKDQFNKQVTQFHIIMQFYITKLLEIMEDIQELEIDMRNMSDLLQMKKLKQSIISCTIKEQRSEKSLISMRQTVSHQQVGQQNEKRFRLSVVV